MNQDLSKPGTSSPQHLEVNRTTLSDGVIPNSKNLHVESSCGPQNVIRELPVNAQDGTTNVHSHCLGNGRTENLGRNSNSNENNSNTQYFHKELKPNDKVKLGIFASSLVAVNKVSRLPPSVAVQSGLVPCVTAPIDITLQNLGDNCVVLPKYAVLGEVYL